MPDQSGRIALVTGGNGGLGYETSKALAAAGAHVVMACRNLAKAETAAARIREARPDASLEVVACDLSSQASATKAAEEIRSRHERIDLFIANAGVMATPRRITGDGWELQLATNHLGHWTLAGRLLDRLLDVPGSRVVTVTSFLHKIGRIDFDDLHGKRLYNRWLAYGQSKLANLLFAHELSRRLLAAGQPTLSAAAHPGYSATELQIAGPSLGGKRVLPGLMGLGNRLLAQRAAMGALPTLYAATAPKVVSGTLIGPDGPFEMRGYPEVVAPSRRAQDPRLAARLWDVSEQLTGVRFPV